MPGGSSRALRMIPALVGIAEDVIDLAPAALFFNYANPMGPNCRAVRMATGAEMIGLCHGVFSVAGTISALLKVPVARMKYNAVGMNHLTWFTEVRVDGRDAIPKLRALARQKLADGAREKLDNPFTWELVDLFGAFPAVLDRHITEFFPHLFHRQGGYYGKTLGVDAINFEDVTALGDRIFEEMRRDALSPKPLPRDYFERIGGEHEQVTEIIESIRRDAGRVYSVNVPNRGVIPNLPEEAIVECPAVADAAGIRAISQPPMPAALAGTLSSRFQWVETIVEAALEGSREKFVQALLIDGAVESVEMAHRLADDLIQAQAKYLPQFRTPGRK
jgi:alpha-galactosidase